MRKEFDEMSKQKSQEIASKKQEIAKIIKGEKQLAEERRKKTEV